MKNTESATALARRCTADRYAYVAQFGRNDEFIIGPGGIHSIQGDMYFDYVRAVDVHHGCFGVTRLERTTKGSWVIWDSSFPGYKKWSNTRFINPESAIKALFGAMS